MPAAAGILVVMSGRGFLHREFVKTVGNLREGRAGALSGSLKLGLPLRVYIGDQGPDFGICRCLHGSDVTGVGFTDEALTLGIPRQERCRRKSSKVDPRFSQIAGWNTNSNALAYVVESYQ